jgi:hypothetical protein
MEWLLKVAQGLADDGLIVLEPGPAAATSARLP